MSDPTTRAKALYDARRTRTPIPPFTDTEPGLGMGDGYEVQQELVRLLLADGDTVVGRKVGLTARPMQQALGIDTPDHGPVLASTLYHDGDTVPLERYIAPKVEAEIVFVLGERLQGPGVTVEQARAAVSGAAAGLEIIDSRIADWRIKLADTVADLASNGGMVISQRIVPFGGDAEPWEPKLVGMTLSRNGEKIDSGVGSAALGDPLAVVAWLANTLGEHGEALEAGQVVLTGALHAAVPMAPGDEFRAEFDRLGAVSITVG